MRDLRHAFALFVTWFGNSVSPPGLEMAPGSPVRRGVAPDRDLRFVVLALDRATGKTVWERTVVRVRPHEVFGPSSLADEIVERWGAKLKQDVDPRSVSATFRRWAAEGEIHQVRDGRAYHEALYTKQRQA